MNSNKRQVMFVVLVLVLLGSAVAGYKNIRLGFPLLPGESAHIWDVEAQINFGAKDGPVKVSLAMPEPGGQFSVLDATYASPGYGFREIERDGVERVEWTRREARGKQTVYYKIKVQDSLPQSKSDDEQDGGLEESAEDVAGQSPYVPELDGSYRAAAAGLIERMREQSSDDLSFSSLLIQALNQPKTEPEAAYLDDLVNESMSSGKYSRTDLMLRILQDAGLPVRKVRGVALDDGRRNQPLVDMVEVSTGGEWYMFDPVTGVEGMPENFLPWQRGGVSLLDVTGGYHSGITFSTISRTVPVEELAKTSAMQNSAALVDFSLYSLPIEEQNAYRYILLVPIGTLIVVLMRILVGLKTSGNLYAGSDLSCLSTDQPAGRPDYIRQHCIDRSVESALFSAGLTCSLWHEYRRR